MNIWIVDGFEKIVHRSLGGHDDDIWSLFDKYIQRPETFEADRANNSYKQLKRGGSGFGRYPVMKYEFDDARRVFVVRMDESLASSVQLIGDCGGVRPVAGEFVFIGVTASGEHDYQGRFGYNFGTRFFDRKRIRLYRTKPRSDKTRTKSEDKNDLNVKLNYSVATYATQLPFDDYEQYKSLVYDNDVVISERQFKILTDIVQKGAHTTSTILMGCAGSGKTLMAVTVMLCPFIGGMLGGKKRIYFALSEKLAISSESSYAKILACKALQGCDSRYFKIYSELRDQVMTLKRLTLSELKRRARVLGLPETVLASDFDEVTSEFVDANAYMQRLIGAESFKLILYNDFKKWFCAKYPTERELSADDVWTEIRGLIKGYLGSYVDKRANSDTRAYKWYWGKRDYAQLRDMYETPDPRRQYGIGKVQGALTRLGIVSASDRNKDHGFFWNSFSDADKESVLKLVPDQALIVEEMFDIVRGQDYFKRELTLGEYLKLGTDQSVYDEHQRRNIYAKYLDYKKWLEEPGKNRLDENDVAREVLKQLEKGVIAPLDLGLSVIDECQDFSEMQLLALTRLVKDGARRLFAGDRHQIINPTYFDNERIRCMPLVGEFEEYFVGDNHRSSREIVAIANIIADKRRSVIGKLGGKLEEPETSSSPGFNPRVIDYGSDALSLKSGLDQIVSDPNVAFIVHDAIDKSRLLSVVSEPFRRTAEANTFTIKECKGLEFKKVFCFDILGKSEYRKCWDTILSSQNLRSQGKYRYYFNTLYVSITRSQSGICLMESGDATEKHADWLFAPGEFRTCEACDFGEVITEFGVKSGTAVEYFDAGEKFFEDAESSHDIDTYNRAVVFFETAAAKPDASADVKKESESRLHACEIEVAKLEDRTLDAALKCIEFNMVDRLPEARTASEEERRDVRLIKRLVADGFARISPEDVRRAIELVSPYETGKWYVKRALEMRVQDLSLKVEITAEEFQNANT